MLTEDVLVLDTHADVFVWVGQSTDSNEKQNAFEIGQRYIEMAASLEGLSSNVPLYKVAEGNEPCFFTTFFSWDPAKAIAHGNSFQKKAFLLFGTSHGAENQLKSNGNQGGPTQRASALAALNSAFSSSSVSKPIATSKAAGVSPRSGRSPGSQRAAAVAALSNVLTSEKSSDKSPTRSPARSIKSPLAEASPAARVENEKVSFEVEELKGSPIVKEAEVVEPVVEANGEDRESKIQQEQEENDSGGSQTTFSYERLTVKSDNPVTGIDFKRREAYLSDAEFESVFEMEKEAFANLPKWKQDMHKRKVDLF